MRRPLSMQVLFVLALASFMCQAAISCSANAPTPLLKQGQPVDWWFVFKFNSASGPACAAGAQRACIFGGEPGPYKIFGQQFVYSSSENPTLQEGAGCAGNTAKDPIGATFDQVYNGSSYYVVWNDQFYGDPEIKGCGESCGSPWGHSKGMVAWNEDGEGFAMQVTTPSWPAAGSRNFPRKTDGNTLGCIEDNNVKVSQHFFSLKLTKPDLGKVLKSLANASVVTNIGSRQLVNNGGPPDIQALVTKLGTKSESKTYTRSRLSTGFELISKPSELHVPPWQMVSAALGGISLRAATWWAYPKIYTTTASSLITCWDEALSDPGPVSIATTGQWRGKTFGLMGGSGPNFNHAKIGVSTSGDHFYSIYGDMNQQGTLSGDNCASSQNGRGGLFYVLDSEPAHRSLRSLLLGGTAPTRPPGEAHEKGSPDEIGSMLN